MTGPKPLPLQGPGDKFHEAGIFVVQQVLTEAGWTIRDTATLFKGLAVGNRVPDLFATRREGDKNVRLVVEVQSRPAKKEMAERRAYYTDRYPLLADRFCEIPLYKLRPTKRDSLKAIREIVELNLA